MAKRPRHLRSTPRGGGFFRGLALGLAVAAVVQLHHAGLPDWLGSSFEESSETSNPIEPSSTNFDFYRLLPKTEVQVDETDLPGEALPPAGQTAAARPPDATDDAQATPALGNAGFRVQVGSFRDRREADRLRASLALNGFESRIVTKDTGEGIWHRVTLGPFPVRAAAEEVKARVLASRGIDAQIVREES